MAPFRTREKQPEAEASTSKVKRPSDRKNKRPRQPKESAIPSLQKSKAFLRQTRRLLAKDKLAADKRVQAERRLKALEAELQQAELSHKERALAVRYHKIKFFERQKVTRKLRQTKRELTSASSSEKAKLSKELLEHRINLNYILCYPKLKKYISLFPPEIRKEGSSGRPPVPQTDPDKTDKEREEIRSWVQQCMEKNEFPAEPELHLDYWGSGEIPQEATQSVNWPTKPEGKLSSKVTNKKASMADETEEDDFFGEDQYDDFFSEGQYDDL